MVWRRKGFALGWFERWSYGLAVHILALVLMCDLKWCVMDDVVDQCDWVTDSTDFSGITSEQYMIDDTYWAMYSNQCKVQRYIYQLHIYSLLYKHQRKMSSPASGSKPKMNLRSTAVKRIMQEASELATTDANDDFVAAPLEVRILLLGDKYWWSRQIYSNGM